MPVIQLRNRAALQDPGVQLDADTFTLRNIPLIQLGPALGHGFEVDRTMLAQVVRFVNAKPKGVKSHLTHPGLTACGGKDGIEVMMGRASNARIAGDKVRADFQLGAYAALGPQGDIRKYLMAIAAEDPELAGVSIQFDADDPETAIVDEPRPESAPSDTTPGKHVVTYARAKNVMAADFVGDPAANRDGLLDRLPDPILSGITPELLNRWAADIARMATAHNHGRSNRRHGEPTMKITLALRQHLQQVHGLAADATTQEILTLLNSLRPDDRVAALAAGHMTESDLSPGSAPAPGTPGTPGVAAAAQPPLSPGSAPGAPGNTPTSGGDVDSRIQAALEADRLANRTRVREIYALANAQGLGDKWALGQIMAGNTVAQAKDAALEHWRASHVATPGLGAAGAADGASLTVTVGEDINLSTIGPAMRDAILLRSGANIYQEIEDHGRPTVRVDSDGRPLRVALHQRAEQFRGMTVLDMFRAHLAAHGATNAFQLSRPELARVLGPRYRRQRYPQLTQSTSDFDNLLLDAANKTFRSLYLDQPNTWSAFARFRTAPDFKNINSVALSEAPDLQQRYEGGEVVYVTLSDSKETYALVEYTGGLMLTRRALINDDLDAFSRAPQLQAAAARRKEEDVVYAILTANAALADGGTLFNATAATTTGGHANQVSGSANLGAPADATIKAANLLMRKQTGPKNAARLDITARFMLVPVEVETDAEKWYVNNVTPGGTNEDRNIWQGKFKPIANSRLSDNSTTAWYLLADYRDGQVDTIEIAFLEGETAPVLEQETDFDTDNLKMKVRHSCAAKAIDFRGMVLNPGA